MQFSVMMVIALGGLGCQNRDCAPSPSPQVPYASSPYTTSACPGYACPSGYSAYGYGGSVVPTEDYSCRGAVRSTLWSFVLGRDPDVASVPEIEATYYSSGYGASNYPGGYGH